MVEQAMCCGQGCCRIWQFQIYEAARLLVVREGLFSSSHLFNVGDPVMSGSNSGSLDSNDTWRPVSQSGGGGEGGGATDNHCAITEKTILNSPNPAVVPTLTVGNILSVELETTPRKRVVVKDAAGQIAGAVTSARLLDIIQCLESGFKFEVEVLIISGGRIELELRPE